jgi:acetyltransferase
LRCRFFTTHPDLSDERIGGLTEVDGHECAALVAVADGHVVGLARYQRRGDTDDALVTLVVDDSARTLDVEVLLLQRLAAVARHEGMRRLLVRVSPIDRALIERLDDSPFDVSRHYHAGIVTITLRLDPYA